MSEPEQASLFAEDAYPIGSRWRVRGDRDTYSIYELITKGGGCFTMRLVETTRISMAEHIGYTMDVERAWFEVRGAAAASAVGSVRRVD